MRAYLVQKSEMGGNSVQWLVTSNSIKPISALTTFTITFQENLIHTQLHVRNIIGDNFECLPHLQVVRYDLAKNQSKRIKFTRFMILCLRYITYSAGSKNP